MICSASKLTERNSSHTYLIRICSRLCALCGRTWVNAQEQNSGQHTKSSTTSSSRGRKTRSETTKTNSLDGTRTFRCKLSSSRISIHALTPTFPLALTTCWNLHGVSTPRQVSITLSLKLFSFSLGKICVPIDPKKPDEFIVSQVPTLTQVINEIGAQTAAQRTHEEGDSLTPQCLESYMATFRSFLRGMESKRIQALREANAEKAQN